MQKAYNTRLNKIENVKQLLKQKFVGLDKFIDNVIEQIIPWYVFQVKTETPVVINIWGITGTGKSEFVKTLCELLEIRKIVLDSQTFLNTSNTKYCQIIEKEKNSAIVIEEFHRIKTIREKDETVMNDDRFKLWEILSGTLNVENKFYRVKEILTGYDRSRWKEKIEVQKIPKKTLTYEIIDALQRNDFYPVTEDFVKELESYTLLDDCETFLLKCEELFLTLPSYRTVSTKNNLIFVIGNLDGAYKRVVEDLEILDADDISEKMNKISTQECKESLLKMFSPEQVARLGSNHSIMPTLTKKGYQNFIHNKIHSLVTEYYTDHEIYFYVDQSVYDMLYQQTVVPTQGLRNVISGMNALFYSPVLSGLSKIIPQSNSDLIIIKYKDSKIVLSTDNLSVVQSIELLNKSNHQLTLKQLKTNLISVELNVCSHGKCSFNT
jgi:cell division protease FtsH